MRPKINSILIAPTVAVLSGISFSALSDVAHRQTLTAYLHQPNLDVLLGADHLLSDGEVSADGLGAPPVLIVHLAVGESACPGQLTIRHG
jgi:hypothetical protein